MGRRVIYPFESIVFMRVFLYTLFKSFRIIKKWGIIMEKPVLSPHFTIEDIHKLREYNYHQIKDLNAQERMDYYNNRGLEIHRIIQERKLQKKYDKSVIALEPYFI